MEYYYFVPDVVGNFVDYYVVEIGMTVELFQVVNYLIVNVRLADEIGMIMEHFQLVMNLNHVVVYHLNRVVDKLRNVDLV